MPQSVQIKESGCSHYKRHALFLTPCCDKLYMCHKCHDESESHILNKNSLKELICTECHTQQKIQAGCIGCGICFGRYACLICNIFDNNDREQYHCEGCGVCRIGENLSLNICPVCSEEVDTCSSQIFIPKCGHLLHRSCYDNIILYGHSRCPVCKDILQ